MKLTRIAVVGAGLIGVRHVESATNTKNTEVVAIVDVSEQGQQVAQSYNVPFFNQVEAMLDKVNPDGVIIATPNAFHIQNALPCIEKGIPTLVEKPFATNMQDAQALIDKAKYTSTPILTGYYRRFNSVVQATKAQISSGRIGKVVSAHSNFWLYKNNNYFDNQWRQTRGAGPININLSHDIDLLLYFMGDIEYLNAYSSNAIRNFEVEDSAVIIAKFTNSALCTINMSDTIPSPWSWELTAGDNPAYPQTDQLYCMIGGSEGSIELPNNRLWYYRNERHWYKPISTELFKKEVQDPLIAQLEHFAAVIRGEAPPIVSGLDGLKVMKVIEAINLSVKDGRRVYLAEV